MVVYDNFGCHEHGKQLFLWQRIILEVVMETVALFYAAVTLAMPQIYLASNVVSGIRCERIPCSSSEHCPAWHHCNMQNRICDPCTVCRDGSDANLHTPNCRDPVRCIDALYAKQDYACPKLRIADGYSCSGVCRSCGGPLGSYLGTTCRVDCSDGDSQVFSCIFLNERAQWNVSRIPHWILRVTTKPPPAQPPASSASTPPLQHVATSPAAYQHQHLEALAGIVAGTVLGVAVIIFFAVALVVCMRRLKRPVEQLLEKSNEQQQQQEQQHQQQHQQQKEQQHDSHLVEPQLHQQIPVSQNLPEENVDTATPLDVVVRTPVEVESSGSWWRSSLPNHATEMSDYDSNHTYAHPSPQSAEQVSLLKGNEQRRSLTSHDESLISLRSERSMTVRQPQEHSPPPGHWPPLLHPPPAGSPDSGHPPCRYSSSNSLQHETLRKSVSDMATAAGVYRREPTEQESQEESSSGLHIPDEDSFEDVNTGYCV